jgi:DNA-binding NarL/FixJ family response regulator
VPEARPIRVVLADDSFLMREAVHQVVGHQDNVEIVADCCDGASLLEEVERLRPDVVITDLRMPPSGDGEGIRVAQRLRETDPGIGVVVLSHYAEPRYGPAPRAVPICSRTASTTAASCGRRSRSSHAAAR